MSLNEWKSTQSTCEAARSNSQHFHIETHTHSALVFVPKNPEPL